MSLDSDALSKKLADKVAEKLQQSKSTASTPNQKHKTEKLQSSKQDSKKSPKKPFSKKDNKKTNDKTSDKPADKNLKKEVGDLIDSLGFDKQNKNGRSDPKNKGKNKHEWDSNKKQKNKNSTKDGKPSKTTDTEKRSENTKPKLQKSNQTEDKKKTVFAQTHREIDGILSGLEDLDSASDYTAEVHKENQPVIEPRNDWYNPSDIEIPSRYPDVPLSASRIESLHSQAKQMLSKENELFIHEGNKSSSQRQFLSQLLTAGTLSDKISAFTLLIQESPLHSVKYFNALLNLCKKKSRGNALQSIAALKDMFVNGVLPDRKLKAFKNQPITNNTNPKVLIIWAFEDWLKQYFFSLIQILEVLSHDTVSYVRSNTIDHIMDLLKSKPEQEANLLRLGVNKLGDPDKQVASRVSYLILKLEEVHPAMNKIIADAISELVFRSTSDYHARYYSVITLNQTILTHKQKDVANSLMRTYLSLFELLLSESNAGKHTNKEDEKPKKKPRHKHTKGKKARQQPIKTKEAVKEEEYEKLVSAILTGMNRAFPFSDLPKDIFNAHIDTIYRVTHSANFNTGVQALILLFQMSQNEKKLTDRFYRTLYESLLDNRLTNSSKLRLYLNLMFRALKKDTKVNRVKAFLKRLIQISNHWVNIGAISGVVYLVSELTKASPALKSLISEGAISQKTTTKNDKNPEEKSEDAEEDLSELYDGKKRDPNFANADKAKIWEIIPLLNHFHPTVSFYTQHYLGLSPEDSPKPIQPDLTLYTLAHFLDRFVYRNPKQKPPVHGRSIMQPLAGSDPTGLVFNSSSIGIEQKPVNFENWKGMSTENVDVGDRFFYNYFNIVQENKKAGDRKKSNTEEDFDLDDEQHEKDIWKALVSSNPSIEADDVDEDDIDLSMSDFGSDDDEEDDDLGDLDDSDDSDEEDAEEDDDILKEIDDEEGVLGSDEEVDVDDSSDEFADLEAAVNNANKKKRDREDDEEISGREKSEKKKSKKQKLKDLPLFASADDYAQYLVSDEE